MSKLYELTNDYLTVLAMVEDDEDGYIDTFKNHRECV